MTCAKRRVFRHRQTLDYWILACQRLACPACFRQVANRWRRILNWAADHGPPPQYLLTLTLREPLPLWQDAPADQQAALRAQAIAVAQLLTRALTRLVAEIRQQFGPFEYLAIVELTTGRRTEGHRPHLHLLVRGPQLCPRWLSDRWSFHTRGSFKIDLQALRRPDWAGDYLIGYSAAPHKQAQRQHLWQWPGPRLRYSRAFFPRPVAQIRALLWPPGPPGQWVFLGLWPLWVQLTWAAADAPVSLVAEPAATG